MTPHTTLVESTGVTLAARGFTDGLAIALVAALFAITVASASAAPTRSGEGAGPGPGDAGQLVDVVCFNIPSQWNSSLEGPLPRCSRTVR